MRILIALNVAVPSFLAATMVAGEKWELMVLPGGALILLLFALVPINIGFILWRWKHYRLRVMIPLLTFVVAGAVNIFAMGCATDFILRGTPCRPESFFNDQTRLDLTQAAQRLVADHERKDFSPEIVVLAQKHSLKPIFVDDSQEIVVFGYYHLRHWYEYIWAKSGLAEPYSMPAAITMADIENWKEFGRIVKQGDTATLAERHRMEFEPSIVFPLLKDSLGAEFLDRVRNASSTKAEFSAEERHAILAALNKQRLASSALVENSQITYEEWHRHWQSDIGPHIAKVYISDSFWEGRLLKQLLSEGVLTLAPDGRHIKLKADLTDKQRLQIEWLHVGIMNFAYGNLVEKRQYVFRKNLGSNWYFNDW
jgi:hypothetical protein